IREIKHGVSFSQGKLTPNHYVVISVRDNGPGMARAMMARIFEPFFTTRPTGNGLGLATANEIVREHGGAINVYSTLGPGSCFEIWVPCHPSDQLTAEETSSIPLLLGSGETVLVVDDERDRLLRSEEMLAALGYEPVGFASAASAIAACKANPHRYDAFLVAHVSSIRPALSAAAALHEIVPDRPILLAASSSGIEASDLIAAGVSGITRWPLVASELATALKRCLPARVRP